MLGRRHARGPLVLTAILGPLVTAGAFACALAAWLAQLGRRSAAWDLLTHAAPFYAVGGALSLAGALFLQAPFRALAIGFGVAAVLGGLVLMAPEFLRRGGLRAPVDAPGALKVVQFNAWGGRGGIERAAAWLADERPDVLIVEESTRRLREAIRARTGMVLSGSRFGVAIFSRAPPRSVVQAKDGRDPPMMLNGAAFETAVGEATVFGVHYPWPTEPDRMARAAELVALIRAAGTSTTILAGDFNSTPWSFARQREDRDFGLIRRTRAVFSWPRGYGPAPFLPIDHVYAGSAWATVSVTRGPDVGSDHYPVIVVLAPRAEPGRA
jgi:endonuclease/exonuclease/phosphatase (EEP) superfamily protein YafD